MKINKNKPLPEELRFQMYEVLLDALQKHERYIMFNEMPVILSLGWGFCSHFYELCNTLDNKITLLDIHDLPIMFPEFQKASEKYTGECWWFEGDNNKRITYLEKILTK